MFILGIFITIGWIFCTFYYGDVMPRNVMIGVMISGLFSMGWGLLTGRR
jgi:hypothetical protein